MQNITIDSEFKSLIPQLSTEELAQLEKNILAEGIRDPLVLWGGILIDGHNRYQIAEKHSIDFDTVAMELPDRDAVKDWMINNQLGKRNLSEEKKRYLRGLQRRREKQKISNPSGKNQHGNEEVKRQNDEQPNTSERLAEQHKVSPRTIERDEKYADAIDKIAEAAGEDFKNDLLNRDVRATQKETIELSKKDPEKIAEIAEKAKETKDIKKVAGAHVSNNSGEDSWYTPKKYIDLVREVMGKIDLDPASTHLANEIVMAENIYGVEEDGLKQDWFGNVFLNPPYSQPLITDFCNKVITENLNWNQVIVLVNNATETKWFNILAKSANAICFPSGRISYYYPDRPSKTPLQGQCFLYFGSQAERFISIFSQIGHCWK